MSPSNTIGRRRSLCRVATILALLLAGMSTASAVTMDISASFRPDPLKPRENTFTNTTPLGGYCFLHAAQCNALGISSVFFPIDVNASGPIQDNHASIRQGAMFKVPAQWRTVTVTHAITGESSVVEMRVAGIGAQYRDLDVTALTGVPNVNVAHGLLWGSAWNEAPSPCRSSGLGAGVSAVTYSFFWHFPQTGVCAKQARYLIPSFRYDQVSFSYELRTPNPLKMSAGRYTGTMSYSIGPGGDFDFGDVMVANDSLLTLNFQLEVEHTLRVEVPPGGNKVVLEPQGGWQAWLNHGQKPTRLFRDQTFHLWASSRFKMNLHCQFADASDNTCMLWAPSSGLLVPVNISVTLPSGLTDAAGQPVNRRRLYLDGSGTELFQPGIFIDRKPGILHFEVGRDQVGQMLTGDAKQYGGTVTVIWDSEV